MNKQLVLNGQEIQLVNKLAESMPEVLAYEWVQEVVGKAMTGDRAIPSHECACHEAGEGACAHCKRAYGCKVWDLNRVAPLRGE